MKLNSHARSEPNFEHVVARADTEQIDGRRSHLPIHTRHDDSAKPSNPSLGATKHA
jgi:hypothetical protein